MSLEEVDNCTTFVNQVEVCVIDIFKLFCLFSISFSSHFCLQVFVARISQQIYEHSEKHFLIDELTIEVPQKECLVGKPIRQRTNFRPEVRVGKFDHLTSLQFGPCGSSGNGVLFPSSQLSSNSTEILSEFTRLWINHQNGVFMEGLNELWQPSKTSRQHFLCHGQSVKDLMIARHDKLELETAFVSPRIIYTVRPSRRAYVLAMQRSYPEFLMEESSSSSRTNWETVQSSLLPLIYSLPSGDQLAIITFDQEEAQLNLPPTQLNSDNRVLLHAAIPRRPALETNFSREACHHCSLSQLQKLQFEEEVEVHVIWLVHSGKFDFAEHLETSSTNANYHHQVVGLDSSLDSSWSKLSRETYVVGGHCQERVSCQGTLTRVLMETVGTSQNSYFIHQSLYSSRGDLSTELELNDKDMTDMVIVLTADNERDIAHLKTSSQSTSQNYAIYSHHMAILHLSPDDFFKGNDNDEAGKLLLEAKMYNLQDRFNVDIYGRKSGKKPEATAWVSTYFVTGGHPQVILYAASTNQEQKVARVTAQIGRPSHRGQELPWVQVHLQDKGTGYPDLSSDDNIFSAYFTELSPEAGFYQVYVTIEYQGQGSSGKTTHILSTSFHLPQSNFYVRKEEGSRLLVNDVFPPNRITDLGVVVDFELESSEELFVTLNWTAPGGDFDHGSSFRYEIRCATSQEALQENIYREQSIPVHTSLIPEPEEAGTQQRCTVGVPWHNQMFFYAIVAIDASGNRGLISNSVSTLVSSLDKQNEIVNDEVTTPKIPLAQPFSTHSGAAIIWAPILAVVLFLLAVSTIILVQRRFCTLKEYVCQEKEVESSTDNSSVTTTSAGVSASSSLDEELSIDLSLELKDSWPSSVDLTPRVHIVEDYMVYRDLSLQRHRHDASRNYDYWQLDQMLSALLAAKCRSNTSSEMRSDSTPSRNESLV